MDNTMELNSEEAIDNLKDKLEALLEVEIKTKSSTLGKVAKVGILVRQDRK